MKAKLLLLLIALICISCKKETVNEPINTDVESMKIEEIIYPLEAPLINTNSSIEPKIRVRSTGNINISSFAIVYHVDIDNTGGGFVAGPMKTFFVDLKPNIDTVLILDKWETYPTHVTPLQNGTHMLLIKIYQINGKQYQNSNNDFEKRLFILQK